MPTKKELDESLEQGMITKEEHEKASQEVEEKQSKGQEKLQEHHEKQEEIQEKKDSSAEGKKSIKRSGILITIIVVAIMGVLGFMLWNTSETVEEEPQTLEEKHIANFRGELDPEIAYVYKNVYSFIKEEDDFWYTQLTTPSGRTALNLAFRYSPRELEHIPIQGQFDDELFNTANEYYVTFNPVGGNFSPIAVGVSDFNLHMTNAFQKFPIAACDRNESTACIDRPVITCDNTDQIVLYLQEAEDLQVRYEGHCILVQGSGLDLVKGVDRVLYNFYNVMGK